jgi:hypothetical protein
LTGINHALTGAVIVSVVSIPFIALPMAFLSHFALDSLPHFGEPFGNRNKFSKSIWTIDGILLFLFISFLVITNNWLALAGAVLAISPDFAWIYRFVFAEKFGKLAPKPTNKFNRFHENIQKLEFKKGIIIEIIWFILFVYLFSSIL